MTIIKAETILSSQHAQRPDKRLTTMVLTYPRFIHAEFMTHRQLSRNASSSRAIPVKKMIQDVIDNPAVPIHWGKNQSGMQAFEECSKMVYLDEVCRTDEGYDYFAVAHTNQSAWLSARDQAVTTAQAFADADYHKQIVNRLLEPFMHIRVVVSSTEWSNFLALRDHPDAEPHFAMLAREVRRELDRPAMQILHPGEWHTPFVTVEDWADIYRKASSEEWAVDTAKKLSAARCASTSYKTVDGFDMTFDKAMEIFDKLVSKPPLHASPFEHVAQVDKWANPEEITYSDYIDQTIPGWQVKREHGNFVGFRQYRKMLPNECL